MEFRILGPLEVVDDGRLVSIRRGKEQALLLYLLLHANEVVSSGRLIDALWDERPPPTASKILQNAVSHIRKELGDGRLVTKDPGYLLRLEPDELDVHHFERLAREGRREEALVLWRGSPLVDLGEERFAEEARRHLEERRLAVVEERIEDDLAAGRHSQLLPELEDLTSANPLREGLQGQLMRALYAAGRQADALEVFQRARRSLTDDLGLEPGPQLQELERKILQHDPELLVHQPRRVARTGPRSRRVPPVVLLAAALLLGAAAIVAGLFLSRGGSRRIVVAANSLAVIDPTHNKVVADVSVGSTPRGVAVSGDAVWVANSADGTVSEIGSPKLHLIRTIGIGAAATDIVEANGRMWVSTGIDNSVVPIDVRSGGVQQAIELSNDRTAAAYALAAGSGAVWAASGDRLIKIDPQTNATHPIPPCCGGIHDVAVGEGAVWLADVREEIVRISKHDGRETGTTTLGVIPTAVKAAFGAVWATVPEPDRTLGAVWRIDPRTMRINQTIPVGHSYSYLANLDLAVGAGSVWVSNYDAGTLVRVDPKTLSVVATIRIGHHPSGVAVGNGRVWVTVS